MKGVKQPKMSDEIKIMKKALAQYERAVRLKRLNQNLYDHLIGSIYCLLEYSQKYNVPLPRKNQLIGMIENANFLIDQFAEQPQVTTANNSGLENEHDEKFDQDSSDEQNLICVEIKLWTIYVISSAENQKAWPQA